MEVRYHFIRGYIEDGAFLVQFIGTKDQLANIFYQSSWSSSVSDSPQEDQNVKIK
jgi:hypothetical protein